MKRSELGFTLALVPIDFFSLLAAATAAYFSRFHPYFTNIRPIIFDLNFENYLTVAIPLTLIFIITFAAAGLYTTRKVSVASELSRIALASSAAMTVIFAITFFSRVLFESRFIALAGWFLAIFFVALGRLVIRGLQRSLLFYGIGIHRTVIIGDTSTAKTLKKLFAQNPRLGFSVITTFQTFNKSVADKLKRLKQDDKIDEVILADPEAARKMTLALISFTEIEHLNFKYSADLFTAAVGKSVIHTFGGIPVIEVRKTPLDGWGAIYKRGFDIFFSGLLILLTSPIMILTALAIKLDSKGPILYAKTDDGKPTLRIGQSGRSFKYFKFRSMKPGTHNMRYNELSKQNTRKGPLVKIQDDPRITKVGKITRKFSIDELPEFFLVLNGTMSLVGPRPHLPEEVDKYKPEHRKVLTIKPGITGMAQTSGRADLDFDDEVRLDTYYIEHWSPWLDLYILLKTPFVVLFKKGENIH